MKPITDSHVYYYSSIFPTWQTTSLTNKNKQNILYTNILVTQKLDTYNSGPGVSQAMGHIVQRSTLNIHDGVDLQKVCTPINGVVMKNISDGSYKNIKCQKDSLDGQNTQEVS